MCVSVCPSGMYPQADEAMRAKLVRIAAEGKRVQKQISGCIFKYAMDCTFTRDLSLDKAQASSSSSSSSSYGRGRPYRVRPSGCTGEKRNAYVRIWG